MEGWMILVGLLIGGVLLLKGITYVLLGGKKLKQSRLLLWKYLAEVGTEGASSSNILSDEGRKLTIETALDAFNEAVRTGNPFIGLRERFALYANEYAKFLVLLHADPELNNDSPQWILGAEGVSGELWMYRRKWYEQSDDATEMRNIMNPADQESTDSNIAHACIIRCVQNCILFTAMSVALTPYEKVSMVESGWIDFVLQKLANWNEDCIRKDLGLERVLGKEDDRPLAAVEDSLIFQFTANGHPNPMSAWNQDLARG